MLSLITPPSGSAWPLLRHTHTKPGTAELTSPSNHRSTRARLACSPPPPLRLAPAAACSPLIAAHLALHLAPSAGNRRPSSFAEMAKALFLLVVVAVSAQALMPTTRAGGTVASSPVAASPRPRTTPVVLASNPIMEFFESLVQKSSTMGKDITLAEAKELCRDPESSGCRRAAAPPAAHALRSLPYTHRPAPTQRSPAASHPHSRPAASTCST